MCNSYRDRVVDILKKDNASATTIREVVQIMDYLAKRHDVANRICNIMDKVLAEELSEKKYKKINAIVTDRIIESEQHDHTGV